MNNVIFLEYYSKRGFPPGKWCYEPDFCKWYHGGLPCLAIRDMSLGVWPGFVGVDSSHFCYSKSMEDILKKPEMAEAFLSVYGGICTAGRLPSKYNSIGKFFQDKSISFLFYWWLGVETSHGGDFVPLLKLESAGPDMDKMLGAQTYKDFSFIRKETNKLALFVSRIKGS